MIRPLHNEWRNGKSNCLILLVAFLCAEHNSMERGAGGKKSTNYSIIMHEAYCIDLVIWSLTKTAFNTAKDSPGPLASIVGKLYFHTTYSFFIVFTIWLHCNNIDLIFLNNLYLKLTLLILII